MEKKFTSYEEFWPYYVAQHRNPTNRALHFVGTSLVIACLVAGFLVSPLWFVAMPFAGYGFAWAGHFLFERNRPATFTYPLWSLRGRLPDVPFDVARAHGPGGPPSGGAVPRRSVTGPGGDQAAAVRWRRRRPTYSAIANIATISAMARVSHHPRGERTRGQPSRNTTLAAT